MSYQHEEKKPRKMSRLKQLSKSNRLMRRYYSGRKPAPQSTPLEKQFRHGETVL